MLVKRGQRSSEHPTYSALPKSHPGWAGAPFNGENQEGDHKTDEGWERKQAKQERQKHLRNRRRQRVSPSDKKRRKRKKKGGWGKGEGKKKKRGKGGKKDEQETDRRCPTMIFSRILVYQLGFPALGPLL